MPVFCISNCQRVFRVFCGRSWIALNIPIASALDEIIQLRRVLIDLIKMTFSGNHESPSTSIYDWLEPGFMSSREGVFIVFRNSHGIDGQGAACYVSLPVIFNPICFDRC